MKESTVILYKEKYGCRLFSDERRSYRTLYLLPHCCVCPDVRGRTRDL